MRAKRYSNRNVNYGHRGNAKETPVIYHVQTPQHY